MSDGPNGVRGDSTSEKAQPVSLPYFFRVDLEQRINK